VLERTPLLQPQAAKACHKRANGIYRGKCAKQLCHHHHRLRPPSTSQVHDGTRLYTILLREQQTVCPEGKKMRQQSLPSLGKDCCLIFFLKGKMKQVQSLALLMSKATRSFSKQ